MPENRRPNILLIILHDLGTHLGCYGQTSVHSPALNRLAEQGVLFEITSARRRTAAPVAAPFSPASTPIPMA